MVRRVRMMTYRWPWRTGANAPAESTAGNRQLTSLTGGVLIPLMGLVLLSGLAMDTYWHAHYAVGFLLVPVVGLKVAATGYRAVSYYGGRVAYRVAGAPQIGLRLLAPVLVVSTTVALGTGVLLWGQHSRSGTLATVHTGAAVICAAVVGLHVCAHAPGALIHGSRAVRSVRSRGGRARVLVVLCVVIAGVGLAAASYGGGTWPAREHRSPGATER
jgi:amino acid transporter